MLPGLISLAFYKRSPRLGQVIRGLVATVVFSALLGYPFPGNPLSHGGPFLGPRRSGGPRWDLVSRGGGVLLLSLP